MKFLEKLLAVSREGSELSWEEESGPFDKDQRGWKGGYKSSATVSEEGDFSFFFLISVSFDFFSVFSRREEGGFRGSSEISGELKERK